MASRSRKAPRRAYHSTLRDQAANETRRRILDALVVVMNADPHAASFAAIAREAGVSVATVYRHYPNKRALGEALKEDVDRRFLRPARAPRTLDELLEELRGFFQRYDALTPELKALRDTPAGRAIREEKRPERLAFVEGVLREPLMRVDEHDRKRLRDVIVVLASSSSLDAFVTYLGLDADGAADRATWAIRTLLRGAEASAPPRETKTRPTRAKKGARR